MIDLKPISRDGVPAALQKAERYRLINDPSSAESICLDVLLVDPDNQPALVALLLSITDQFAKAPAAEHKRAMEFLPRLRDEYKRAYYEGLVCERRAKAHLALGTPNVGEIAYDWFHQAMAHYERAERMRPPGNDESILRWNTCARILERGKQHLRPTVQQEYEPSFE